MDRRQAVIIGAGDGLSASLARNFAPDYDVTLVARSGERAQSVADDTGAQLVVADATDEAAIRSLFDALPSAPRVVVYNPSARTRGPVAELEVDTVRKAIDVTAIGALIAGKHATRHMLAADPIDGVRGTILFTGASAGVKGFPQSAPFAMGKFAQRGLAQSMARELHPQGIHVVWVGIDGQIAGPRVSVDPDNPDRALDPDAIAASYRHLVDQPRSAWANELNLRPWVERF